MNNESSRGGEWVVWQFVLLASILVAPRRLPGTRGWSQRTTWAGRVLGVACLFAAFSLMRAGGQTLGRNLTPFPRPRASGTLVQTGVYGQVRHPLYVAFILAALGWSLLRGSTPSLFLTAVLALFFDRKATLEETWLVERFPEYVDYRQRVAKLVPWVY